MRNVTNELRNEVNGKEVEWAYLDLTQEPKCVKKLMVLLNVDIKKLEELGQVSISEIDGDKRFVTYIYETEFINKLSDYSPDTLVEVEVTKSRENISINTTDIEEVYELFKDVTYHDGYGRQYLYGTVMFTDGEWLERREYDGSEWWEHITPPTRP
jgi:hypothetical protein